jgi:mycoredoxin-dependent peroxiredoxin
MAAQVGEPAPDFTLLDQTRTPVSLSEFKGKKTLVVFIPFAFSPTCGSELCTIRDNLAALSSVDANVVAISTDSHHANRVWTAQEGFEFKILSDFWPHGGVAQAYGCFNEQVGCAMRATYVLDEDGIVRAIVSTESLGQARQFGSYQEALAAI